MKKFGKDKEFIENKKKERMIIKEEEKLIDELGEK